MDDCKEKDSVCITWCNFMRWKKSCEIFEIFMRFEYDRDISEYIYDREKLKTLSGKKLHGKRNHINQVLKKIMNGPMNHFPMKIS